MSISAVVLDLDGVLIDTESLAFRAWQQAAEEFGFKISLEAYSRIIGRTVEAARAEILEIIPDRTAIDQYMKRSDVLYFDTMEREGIRLMPGVLELLDWVEQIGLNHTVATSSDRVHAEWKIQLAGLTERIGEFVTCNDVQRGKPAPDTFLHAAKLVNQPIERCVVVEDAEAGIIGASTAGAIPIMLPGALAPSENARSLAYGIAESLAEVLSLIKKLHRQDH